MMLSYRYYISCSSFFEQACPCLWIEFFSLKHGDEIFETEFCYRTVFFNVMLIYVTVYVVHISGVPSVVCWYGSWSPMYEYTEFTV